MFILFFAFGKSLVPVIGKNKSYFFFLRKSEEIRFKKCTQFIKKMQSGPFSESEHQKILFMKKRNQQILPSEEINL